MMSQPVKPRILVVDDHPANRRAFESILEADYTVVLAEDGAQALELTLLNDFAAILLDVRMPGMDGFEVAELLRDRERTRYTPIVFMSAFDQNVIQTKRGYLAGGTDFIFSPVDEDLLKYKVAAYVRIYQRNEALWLRILQLQATFRTLQMEVGRTCPTASIQTKIRRLTDQIESLKEQVDPVPL
jgi:CheY-like chemotaxis protein